MEIGLLAELRPTELAQVWFVRSYLQLIFEGDRHWSLQCLIWPTLTRGEARLDYGDEGYRDALCSLIGSDVDFTEEAVGAGLVIWFESGSSLSINPGLHELIGPEIAIMTRHDRSGEFGVWRPGEGPFSNLM